MNTISAKLHSSLRDTYIIICKWSQIFKSKMKRVFYLEYDTFSCLSTNSTGFPFIALCPSVRGLSEQRHHRFMSVCLPFCSVCMHCTCVWVCFYLHHQPALEHLHKQSQRTSSGNKRKEGLYSHQERSHEQRPHPWKLGAYRVAHIYTNMYVLIHSLYLQASLFLEHIEQKACLLCLLVLLCIIDSITTADI